MATTLWITYTTYTTVLEEFYLMEYKDAYSAEIHAVFLFGLIFAPEDGEHMFIGNVGSIPTDSMALCKI
jgi:hypothetical protein